MASLSPLRTPLPHDDLLRDLLGSSPGWVRDDGPCSVLRAGGRRYRLVPLARQGDARALLCEAPLGEPLPAHPVRRALRRRIRRRQGRALVVFTDAAHADQVWSWEAVRAAGPRVYREHRSAAGGPAAGQAAVLRAAARELDGPPPHDRRPAPRTRRAVLLALLREVRARHPGLGPQLAAGPGLARRVQETIEGSGDPGVPRAFWRALAGRGRAPGLAVLDPACGAGEWLLDVMATLEPVYLACLERMRIWLDEQDRGRTRPRPERLRDFRELLARADDPSRHASPLHFVRETIALRNLHGIDRSGAALAVCAARLAARAGRADGLAWNLWPGTREGGFWSVGALRAALAARPDGPAALRRIVEEAEVLDAVAWLAREQGVPDEGLAARRATLCAELDRLRPRAGAVPAVHGVAVCYGVVRRGGFHLVRGGAR